MEKKIAAGGFAGALSILLVWGLHSGLGINVPPEVASALTTVITIGVAWIKKS